MKKTKQTMLTAALLSTALVMQGELSQLSNVPYASAEKTTPLDESPGITQPVAKTTTAIETTEVKATTTTITEMPLPVTTETQPEIKEISVMYGPPFISGDANLDDKLNIADYVMLKDKLMNGDVSHTYWREDINQNGEFDTEDLKIFEHYFLNLLPYQTDEDTASVTEPVTSETTEAITTITMPETTPLRTLPEPRGTLYGPPEAIDQYRKLQ